MQDFKSFFSDYETPLLEGVKLTHLEHVEDLIITDGYNGLVTGVNFLKTTLEVLVGNSDMTIQGKIDGAPSIIAGINPENGKFFVATKSLFNKTPKINYTSADIDLNHGSSEVSDKLKVALKELPKLGIKNIIQGDMLFYKTLIKKEKIEGKEYVTFRPNTITYAVPADSKLAKDIRTANIGMAWHTTYTGSEISNLSASFNIDISSHKEISSVFNTDTNLEIENVLIDKNEYASIIKRIDGVLKEAKKFNKQDLSYLTDHKLDILTYINSKVREGETVNDSMVKGLFDFVYGKYDKQKDKLKTQKGKDKKEQAKKDKITELRKVAGTLWHTLNIHQEVQKIKNIIVKKLDTIKSMDTFIETDDGYEVTSPEGYVAIDKLQGGAVKLVDRLEFSKNNFNIVRNW